MPGPQVCVGGCLRVVTRGMAVGARFRGASGTPPPTVCPGMGGSGSLRGWLPGEGRRRKPPRGSGDAAPYGPEMGGGGRPPLIRPCGATFPQGGRQGLLLAAAQGFAGCRGRRPYGWGYGNAVGFTRTPVPGPPHGRGRACPARGVTRTPVNGSVRREGS